MTQTASRLPSVLLTKQAVLFDLFHTLTPLESSWGDRRPMTHELLRVSKQAWHEQLLVHSRDRLAGEKTDAFAIIAGMARAIDPTIPDAVIRTATENRTARFAAALANITPETRHVIQTLRQCGLRIGLISNADVMEVAGWAQCPIADLFDATVFSCHVGWVKPEAEIYQLCLKQLNVSPAASIFVGDGGSNELAGAKTLGLTTVMIAGIIRELWPEKIAERATHADFQIEHLPELLHQ
ncbi:MAG: HAD family hydrolase [Opitutaceae bacterium]